MKAPTYQRRGGPIDIELEAVRSPEVRSQQTNSAAEQDYARNLKRTGMNLAAAEPNRNKGNESGQKPK